MVTLKADIHFVFMATLMGGNLLSLLLRLQSLMGWKAALFPRKGNVIIVPTLGIYVLN